jgi:site-specific recombinase XerC
MAYRGRDADVAPLLESGSQLRAVQELTAHNDAATARICIQC